MSGRPGNWTCPDPKYDLFQYLYYFRCENLNFAKRDVCNLCGSSKPTGLDVKKPFKANPDDWNCKSCGNINWAKRLLCNMCNAPKNPPLENRTGYGGGFMERDEVVEYKNRSDSEDEYDEYGRIKKKYRKLDKNANESPKEKHKPDDEVRVPKIEEEEESGDEAELGKYDLCDSSEKSSEASSSSESSQSHSSDSSTSSDGSSSDEESSVHDRSRSPTQNGSDPPENDRENN